MNRLVRLAYFQSIAVDESQLIPSHSPELGVVSSYDNISYKISDWVTLFWKRCFCLTTEDWKSLHVIVVGHDCVRDVSGACIPDGCATCVDHVFQSHSQLWCSFEYVFRTVRQFEVEFEHVTYIVWFKGRIWYIVVFYVCTKPFSIWQFSQLQRAEIVVLSAINSCKVTTKQSLCPIFPSA